MKNQIKIIERYNYKSTTTVGLYTLVIMLLLMLFTALTSCSKKQSVTPQTQSINTIAGNYKDHNSNGCSYNINIQFTNNEYYITSPDYWSCNKKLYMSIATSGSIYNININDKYEYNNQLDTINATGYIQNDTLTLFMYNTVITSGSSLFNQQPLKHIYTRI